MSETRITVAHSPDSDDAFMFFGLASGAVGDGAGASIRFGLGRWTSDADVDFAISRVTTVVRSLRQRQAVGR